MLLYVVSFTVVALATFYLYFRKNRFSQFQNASLVAILLICVSISSIQIFNPRADSFNLMCAMVLYAVYVVFENPAQYTHHATRCFNERAFHEEMTAFSRVSANPDMLLIGLNNRPETNSAKDVFFYSLLMDEVADRLETVFGKNVFCIESGKYVLIVDDKKYSDYKDAVKDLEEAFDKSIKIRNDKYYAEIICRHFTMSDIRISEDYVDHFTEVIRQNQMDHLIYNYDIGTKVMEQHNSREIEDAIIRGVEDDNFSVFYQPLFDINENSFTAAEALLRLNDPQMGNIRPDMFIPIAEKSGFIVRVGEMVLEKVCRFMNSHSYIRIKEPIIGVNVSPVQLSRKGESERLINIMKKYSIDASKINMEITESFFEYEDKVVKENNDVLLEYGVTFSVDDYGAGFATVDYLYTLPFTFVKIDRMVIVQAMENENAMIVFKSTVDLVKKMNKLVVVEGIENQEMLDVVASTGADYIQGYLYSRPLEEKKFVEFMIDNII
ncbi:MAG: EAL domain-containing protein [Erysipelotrichaceae bacterium]|nr:EAL domain-containing protein [Erysipelotrichaceae bacterium]